MNITPPRRPEINERTTKLIVGVIAIGIASVTSWLAPADQPLKSISASYFAGDWSRNVFVGFLFAIAAFLMSYNGHTGLQKALSRVAALAALGVALFPCRCDSGHPQILPYVHYIAAAILFAILAYFCLAFHQQARRKGHPEARRRAAVYLACFWAMVLAMAALGINGVWGKDLGWDESIPRFVFVGEAVALVAFGISWLVASRVLPLLTRPDERHHLLGEDPPGMDP